MSNLTTLFFWRAEHFVPVGLAPFFPVEVNKTVFIRAAKISFVAVTQLGLFTSADTSGYCEQCGRNRSHSAGKKHRLHSGGNAALLYLTFQSEMTRDVPHDSPWDHL